MALPDLDALRERWTGLCERVGAFASVDDSEMTFEMVTALYERPRRAYHTLEHVADCLRVFDKLSMLADHPDALEFAIWLHDCVYHPERHDNEMRSADEAGMVAGLLGCAPDFVDEVRTLVLVTRHDSCPVGGDASLIADIDLAILGADAERYEHYRSQIREEFAFANDEDFGAGRTVFIERMLDRPCIYATAYVGAILEDPARENLHNELDTLHGL